MSELLLALRVVLALGVVLLLLVGLSRWAAKRNGGASTRTLPVSVVGRVGLGRTAGVAVVEVGERLLVVGVAEHQVNLLTELPAAALPLGIALEIPLLESGEGEGSTGESARDPAAEGKGAAVPVAAAPARLAPVPAGAGVPAGVRADVATFEGALAAHSARLATDTATTDTTTTRAPQPVYGETAAAALPSRRRRAELERARGGSRGEHRSGHRGGDESARGVDRSALSFAGRAVSGSILDPDTWRRTARALGHLRRSF